MGRGTSADRATVPGSLIIRFVLFHLINAILVLWFLFNVYDAINTPEYLFRPIYMIFPFVGFLFAIFRIGEWGKWTKFVRRIAKKKPGSRYELYFLQLIKYRNATEMEKAKLDKDIKTRIDELKREIDIK